MIVYFLGIGGTAMGHAAVMLKNMGHEVFGSDLALYPPMSDVLKKEKIKHFVGFDAQRLAEMAPDLIVVGNAISRGNVEVEWILNHPKVEAVSLPDLIRKFFLKNKTPIVVTGTHGKTTTSSLIAFLLKENACDPSWFIGGVPKSLPSGAQMGMGEAFVIEGDEYDSAFFDKRSKFIHYKPFIALINNIEMDHADIFRDLDDVKKSFSHFIKLIPSDGYLIINGDDANIRSLLPAEWCTVLSVGLNPENDCVLSHFHEDENGCSFKLTYKEQYWCTLSLKLSGLFNARNAAMAVLASAIYKFPMQPELFCADCLSHFEGVMRRQECLYKDSILAIYEDFAHHPSSLEATIQSFKSISPSSELIVCFEPRSNTARSALFQEAFIEALKGADVVKLAPITIGSHIATANCLDTKLLAEKLREINVEAKAYPSNEDMLKTLVQEVRTLRIQKKQSTILFLTNGSFDGIIKRFVEELN